MYQKYEYANVLVALVSAPSVASIILTRTLFAFVNIVQNKTGVMKEHNVFVIPSDRPHLLGDSRTEGGNAECTTLQAHRVAPREGIRLRRGGTRHQADVRSVALPPIASTLSALLSQAAQPSNRTSKDYLLHHQHCLNYLRQRALCHPDFTLESRDIARRRATLRWIASGRHIRFAVLKPPRTTTQGTGSTSITCRRGHGCLVTISHIRATSESGCPY